MTKRATPLHHTVTAAASALELVDGTPVTRVKLLPMGDILLRDGRGPYRLRDRAHAEQVIAATRTFLGTLDFNFDYDHQVKAAAEGKGGQAKAAGWIKPDTLSVEDDGIWGDVDWTAAAAAAIAAREYRYVSPYFVALPPAKGGDVIHMKNAALVNIGAIDLPAVAAGLSEEDENMDLTAIAAALGLAATATVEEIAAAITELKKPSTSAIAIAAGLAETAGVEEIAATVAQMKANPDPAKFVPIDQVTSLTSQLGTLNDERAEREVAAAVQSGKLAPAMKPWGLSLFKNDEQAWRDYVGNAPVIVAAGLHTPKGDPKTKFTELTVDEIAACEMTGVSHEDFLKAKNEEVA